MTDRPPGVEDLSTTRRWWAVDWRWPAAFLLWVPRLMIPVRWVVRWAVAVRARSSARRAR